MKDSLPSKYAQLIATVAILTAVAALAALMLSDHAVAQPTTFVSPLSPQQTEFLSVPYYDAQWINAYVDHDPLGASWGTYNDRIELFDGRTANQNNGVCGHNSAGRPIACYTQPGSQGQCLWYDSHNGNDFSLNYEPVLAPTEGQVIRAGWQNWNDRQAGYGLHLIIAHANGYETRYGHLSALTVITNVTVSRGQIIGTSGNTGYSSGPHLHFEVRLNGTATDPFGGAGADWLWQDGLWDAQGRWVGQPEPHYGAPLVVDDDNPQQVGDPNDDPYFTKGHGGIGGASCPPDSCPYWYRDTSTGWDGDMLYTYILGTTSDYWARWSPPHHGLYDVQVWIPGNHATTWEARYWLVSSYNYMPSMYMVVDQWGTCNQWVSLGIHEFGYWPDAPWVGLWIFDKQVRENEYWRKVGVDAIRFRTPWPIYLPLVMNDYPPPCAPARSISCGGVHYWNNSWSGSTDAVEAYSCVGWDENGPEYTYSFVPNVSGTATASLSNMSADLDVFVLNGLSGTCHPDNCITYGNTHAEFYAVAGRTYYIVVDGYKGAVSNYKLSVSCSEN